MQHIVLTDDRRRKLVFYLAMEEYIAAHIGDVPCDAYGRREAFFMWQVEPTVIFGRNQVMEAEVNMEWCRQHGVQMYRRKSGGGCVYSDAGNIMLSYVTDSTDVGLTFDSFLQRVVMALRRAGLDASRSGRNDVLVGGKKVSGNAFFLKANAGIVHGTMLFDSDFDALASAITPSSAKIASKGVNSVRQHVTNVREEFCKADARHPELSDIEKFKAFIVQAVCGAGHGVITLDAQAIAEIEEIERGYLDPDFIAGRKHGYSISKTLRFDGVGELTAGLEVDGNDIVSCNVSGDYFPLKDGLSEALTGILAGCPLSKAALALENFDAGAYVKGLSNEQLIKLIINY